MTGTFQHTYISHYDHALGCGHACLRYIPLETDVCVNEHELDKIATVVSAVCNLTDCFAGSNHLGAKYVAAAL